MWRSSLSVLAGLMFLTSACHRGIDSRDVGETQIPHITKLFNHEKHFPIMDQYDLDCLSCHADKTTLKDVRPAAKVKREFTCHDCHRNAQMISLAPQRCEGCHTDLHPVKPASHFLNWNQRHATFAKTDPLECASCHTQESCVDCHMQRDSIQQTAHPRTFLYSHSIEARANPHACGSCHQKNFCTDCHVGKGVLF